MYGIITFTITLINEFQLFFKSKGVDFNSGVIHVIVDFLTRIQTRLLDEKFREFKISPRERQVIQHLIRGFQTKEINERMHTSIHTTKNHIRSIFKKCKVGNKIELFIKLINLKY